MSDRVAPRVAALTGAATATRGERIQSLWSGYGEVVRYALEGAQVSSVVVKHVTPGAGSGRSHDRKLRSYDVELAWYDRWAPRCTEGCRVARCHGAERGDGQWLFVLEDLDASGFAGRRREMSDRQRGAALRWLASLHATFMGERPRGLWKTGTYWHLGTRPDEHRAMAPGPLRKAAAAIDQRLDDARFKTIVHGDAKPANFCFAGDGRTVAAVDFQYVGGGCGMKDVAYLLTGADAGTTRGALDLYFGHLRKGLHQLGHLDRAIDDVESEWRELYPWTWADFHRFLAGWAPGHQVHPYGNTLTGRVLAVAR